MKENEIEVEPRKNCENVENFKKYYEDDFLFNEDYDYLKSHQKFLYMVLGLKDKFEKMIETKQLNKKVPPMVNLQGYAHVLEFIFSKVASYYADELWKNHGKTITEGYVKVYTSDIELCTLFDYQALRDYRQKLESIGLIKFRSIGKNKSEVEYLVDMEAYHNLIESGKRIYEEKKTKSTEIKKSRVEHIKSLNKVVKLPEYSRHLDYSWDEMPDMPEEPSGVTSDSTEFEEYNHKCYWALLLKIVHNASFFFNCEKFEWNEATVNSFKKYPKTYWTSMVSNNEFCYRDKTTPLILGCSKKLREYINSGSKQLRIETSTKNVPKTLNDTINWAKCTNILPPQDVALVKDWIWNNRTTLCIGSIEDVKKLREQALKVLPEYLFQSPDID